MNKRIFVSLLGAATLFIGSGAVLAADQDRQRDQARDQKVIYGYQLMTEKEREEYRAQMRKLKTAEEREQFRKKHHEKMQARATEQGKMLPDMPPPRGKGMNKGKGMGDGGRP